jgi:hypothetical protein
MLTDGFSSRLYTLMFNDLNLSRYKNQEQRFKSCVSVALTNISPQVFTCDWWYNVNCAASESMYNLNDNLYRVNKHIC